MGNKENIFQPKWPKEFIKFNIVGITNAVVTYIVYATLVSIGFHYMIALTIDYIVGLLWSFTLNKRFTFRIDRPSTPGMFLRMVGVYVVIFTCNSVLLIGLMEIAKLNPYIAQLLALFVIVIAAFLGQKYIVFKDF